jgi:hypothetical protein
MVRGREEERRVGQRGNNERKEGREVGRRAGRVDMLRARKEGSGGS